MTEWLPKTLPGVTVKIDSKAGVSTCVDVRFGKKLHILFDVGTCTSERSSATHVFVSHSHLDHVGGVFTHARLRSRMNKVATYFVPAECIEDFQKAKEGFEGMDSIERTPFPMNIVPVKPGDIIELNKEFSVEVCQTKHRVPSVGYVISRRMRTMRTEFKDLSADEKRTLAQSGVALMTSVLEAQVAYTGDTIIDGILDEPKFLNSKLLITEMTFLGTVGNKDTVENAREKGHIHLDEFVAQLQQFAESPVERIVFCHFSVRYNASAIVRAFRAKVPEEYFSLIGVALGAFGTNDRTLENFVAKQTQHTKHVPCRFHFTRGNCRMGKLCNFSHEKD